MEQLRNAGTQRLIWSQSKRTAELHSNEHPYARLVPDVWLAWTRAETANAEYDFGYQGWLTSKPVIYYPNTKDPAAYVLAETSREFASIRLQVNEHHYLWSAEETQKGVVTWKDAQESVVITFTNINPLKLSSVMQFASGASENPHTPLLATFGWWLAIQYILIYGG